MKNSNFKNNHEEAVEKNKECHNKAKRPEDNPDISKSTQEDSKEIKEQLEKKNNEANEYLDRLQRMMAEFDNFKKRTAKEKEMIYSDAVSDIMTNLLPVIDNLELALGSCNVEDLTSVINGVKMIQKQFKDLLQNYGISEIEAVNQDFNPIIHDAVIHVEDENVGEGVVIEELRKGYKCGDKVLRHSMVKVAN